MHFYLLSFDMISCKKKKKKVILFLERPSSLMVVTFMVHYMLQSTLVRRPMDPLGGGAQRQKLFWMPMTRSD